jgi:hypothetical protein
MAVYILAKRYFSAKEKEGMKMEKTSAKEAVKELTLALMYLTRFSNKIDFPYQKIMSGKDIHL